jgi:hypothetical protein
MAKLLTISVEPLELPTDFEAETAERAKLSGPVTKFRAALTEALGRDVGIKYTLSDSTAVPAPPAKRGRPPKEAPSAPAAAPGPPGTDLPHDTAEQAAPDTDTPVIHRGRRAA